MHLPPGFHKQGRIEFVDFNKLIYRLKQAPHIWFTTLSSALIDVGFIHY